MKWDSYTNTESKYNLGEEEKMKKLKKIVAAVVAAVSILATNATSASAEWKQSGNGWWYSQGGKFICYWLDSD